MYPVVDARAQAEACASAFHPRLGSSSPLNLLDAHLLPGLFQHFATSHREINLPCTPLRPARRPDVRFVYGEALSLSPRRAVACFTAQLADTDRRLVVGVYAPSAHSRGTWEAVLSFSSGPSGFMPCCAASDEWVLLECLGAVVGVGIADRNLGALRTLPTEPGGYNSFDALGGGRFALATLSRNKSRPSSVLVVDLDDPESIPAALAAKEATQHCTIHVSGETYVSVEYWVDAVSGLAYILKTTSLSMGLSQESMPQQRHWLSLGHTISNDLFAVTLGSTDGCGWTWKYFLWQMHADGSRTLLCNPDLGGEWINNGRPAACEEMFFLRRNEDNTLQLLVLDLETGQRLAAMSIDSDLTKEGQIVASSWAQPGSFQRPKQAPPLNSAQYWEDRYKTGGTSGIGSYGLNAEFKARVLNTFVRDHNVESVIEWGVGDGNQLKLAQYPKYTGIDVSPWVLRKTAAMFAQDDSKSFLVVSTLAGVYDKECVLSADLAMSLDVVYHLVEDEALDYYMCALVNSARRYLIIFAWPPERQRVYKGSHVRDINFHGWIAQSAPWFKFVKRIPNEVQDTEAEFFIYERTYNASAASPTIPTVVKAEPST
eukprot:m51a1_g2642 hypothetical protein (600) ;mRNA; f:600354-602519